jgi:DNA polymerase elongation subunit (family B)
MAEKFKIMRAWDKGLNKIAYVYRNPETGKKGIGETKFDWFFYVLTDDYERLRNKFNQFISNNVINSIEPEGKYTRIYADYPHRTESLSKELERDWGYKTFAFNDMLEKLKMLECETFEADILPHARFAIQDNVEFEQDYKGLFFDIETDDRIKNGQPIPGEFRILSVAMKDFTDGKEAFMRIAEDTDEEERNLLIRFGKILNGYDVIIGWNSCFPKDTRITMNDGSYKNIQDVVVGDRVLSYRHGRSEISEVKHLFKHKNYKAIYKIKTDKREIVASDEHPFLATYSNVNRWVRAKNLRVGDYLTKFRRIDLPSERRDYRPEDYLFCGMIMTDGHIPTAKPGWFDFHTTNEQYLRWMKKYLTRNGISFSEYVKRDDNPNHKKQYQLKCKNFDYWKMLLDLGVPMGRKTEKEIDLSKIYQQSRNRIKAFLLGLWIGDGYKTQKNQQYICNQNTDLCEWVVKLFARIGENWYITKFSKDNHNFFHGVGRVQLDHIPTHYVKKANINDGFKLGGALSDILNEKTPCTSGQFERFFNDDGDVAALSFEQVLSIEIIPFDDYVYNFETGNHTYIANDLIVHNCSFDIPYVKSRMMRYGIQLDWRKIFHQDQMKVFQKSVSLRSYSLENVSQEYLGEGKVQHEGIGVYEMWLNHPELLEKYNRVDVRRCFELENKTKYLAVARNVNAIGMCPCDDLYITRKIDNLVVKQAQIDKHYHFKTVIKEFDENGRMIQDDDDDDDDKFEGAYVFPPKPGRYKNIKVFDYSSLYPNVIKTLNISPDTLVTDDSVPDEMCIKTPSGHKFRKDFVGILPKVIAGMKDKRDFYKDLMSKETPGSLMHKTYDNLQYVYKSFGLSFYGALGEIHTRFYDIRIAESVTLGGQYFNKAGAKFLEDKAYSIIYGDTDSLFVDHIKHDDEVVTLLEQIKELCEKIAKEEFNADICTLEMSYDKGFKTFLIVNAKKRYAGYIDYLDGHEVNPCKLKITGFEYVRTDQCGFVKKYQKEILEWILSDEPPTPVQIRAWILDKQTKVFSGKLPLDELMFAQKVTKPIDQYDKPMMHTKVAEQMMKDGKDFWIGDKVPYFIESFDTRKKPLPRPLYAFKGKYNESYYWNNKIFPAFERVLVVAYPTVKWDEYYIKGASTGSAKAGRSFLWN